MFLIPPPLNLVDLHQILVKCLVTVFWFILKIEIYWNAVRSLSYLKTYTYKIYSNHRYGRYKEGLKKSPVGLWFLQSVFLPKGKYMYCTVFNKYRNTRRVLVDAGGLWIRNFITFLLSSGGNPEFRFLTLLKYKAFLMNNTCIIWWFLPNLLCFYYICIFTFLLAECLCGLKGNLSQKTF